MDENNQTDYHNQLRMKFISRWFEHRVIIQTTLCKYMQYSTHAMWEISLCKKHLTDKSLQGMQLLRSFVLEIVQISHPSQLEKPAICFISQSS